MLENISSESQRLPTLSSRHGAVFEYFSKLPIELRLEIWTLVCFQPRHVMVLALRIDPYPMRRTTITIHYFGSSNPIPAILHTNSEARTVGLGYYEPCFYNWAMVHHFHYFFNATINADNLSLLKEPRIYAHLAIDRICPVEDFTDEAFDDLEKNHGVQNMALGLISSPMSIFKREDGFLQRLNVEQIFIYDGTLDCSNQLKDIDDSDDLNEFYESQVEEFEDDLEEIGEGAYESELVDLEDDISSTLDEQLENLQERYDDMQSRTVKALKLVPN